jgi:hypothetical protein
MLFSFCNHTNFHPKYGDSMFLQNISIDLQNYVISAQKITWNYWVFELCSLSGIQKTPESTTFLKLDLFLSSGEGGRIPTLLGPLEGAHLNHQTSSAISNTQQHRSPPPPPDKRNRFGFQNVVFCSVF